MHLLLLYLFYPPPNISLVVYLQWFGFLLRYPYINIDALVYIKHTVQGSNPLKLYVRSIYYRISSRDKDLQNIINKGNFSPQKISPSLWVQKSQKRPKGRKHKGFTYSNVSLAGWYFIVTVPVVDDEGAAEVANERH